MDSPFEAPSILIEPPEDDNQQLGIEQDFPSSTFTAHALQSIANSHYFDSTGFNPEDDLLGDFSYNCEYLVVDQCYIDLQLSL
jgi:hypothetical protein